MVHLYFHTGHVVFSNITNMSKSEHHICHKSFDEVDHWYKGTDGMSKNQWLSYYRSCDAINKTTCPV